MVGLRIEPAISVGDGLSGLPICGANSKDPATASRPPGRPVGIDNAALGSDSVIVPPFPLFLALKLGPVLKVASPKARHLKSF